MWMRNYDSYEMNECKRRLTLPSAEYSYFLLLCKQDEIKPSMKETLAANAVNIQSSVSGSSKAGFEPFIK